MLEKTGKGPWTKTRIDNGCPGRQESTEDFYGELITCQERFKQDPEIDNYPRYR